MLLEASDALPRYNVTLALFFTSFLSYGVLSGGSICRPEATGFGCVFMASEIMQDMGVDSLKDLRCAVSGAGNVAYFCAKKLIDFGAKVVSLSDSQGTLVEPSGFTMSQLKKVSEIKSGHNGKLSDYMDTSEKTKEAHYAGDRARPWKLKEISNIDIAFPCATQNEVDEEDAEALAEKKCRAVIEGANMPTSAEAAKVLSSRGILHVPGKMANAGGVGGKIIKDLAHDMEKVCI